MKISQLWLTICGGKPRKIDRLHWKHGICLQRKNIGISSSPEPKENIEVPRGMPVFLNGICGDIFFGKLILCLKHWWRNKDFQKINMQNTNCVKKAIHKLQHV